MLLALVLCATTSNPRVLVVGTRFDDVEDAAKARVLQLADEAFIAGAYTVRISDCATEKCALTEAGVWHAGAVIVVSAARLGREISIAFRALAGERELAKGDALVDLKKLEAASADLDKFARTLKPKVPITTAPEPPKPAPAEEPPPLTPKPEPVTEGDPQVREPAPDVPKPTGAIVLGISAALLAVGSGACFALAGVNDQRLGASRSAMGVWSISQGEADSLRTSVKFESAIGSTLLGLALVAVTVALLVW